jgi:hypothetical protein
MATGLSAAGISGVSRTAVQTAMTRLAPGIHEWSRRILGGRIGAMFRDFGTLLAERRTPPQNNVFAPLIPLQRDARATCAPQPEGTVCHSRRSGGRI